MAEEVPVLDIHAIAAAAIGSPHPFGILTDGDRHPPCYSNPVASAILRHAGRDAAKAYVLARVAVAVDGRLLLWRGGRRYISLKGAEVKNFIQVVLLEHPNSLNLGKWFKNHSNEHLSLTFRPNEDAFTFREDGQAKLNTFPGFAFGKLKPLGEFSEAVKAKMNLIIRHQLKVFCSGKLPNFRHWLSWQAACLAGERTEVIYYLEAAQGTGKTMLVDSFFGQKVLGPGIAGGSDSYETLLGTFNSELNEKVFFTFSDAVASGKEWARIYKAMKSATDGTIRVRKMYQDATREQSRINICIMSQDSLKIEAGDRRMAYMEFDNSFAVGAPGQVFGMSKLDYYSTLAAATEDREVAGAYAAFLTQWRADHPTNLRELPQTEERDEAMGVGMELGCKFVKDFFLKGARELARYPSSVMADDYARWRGRFPELIGPGKRGEVSKHLKMAFGWRLEAAAIVNGPQGRTNSRYFSQTTAQLLAEFKARRWWTVDDEAEMVGVQPAAAGAQAAAEPEVAAPEPAKFPALGQPSAAAAATLAAAADEDLDMVARIDKNPQAAPMRYLRSTSRVPSRAAAKCKAVEYDDLDSLFDD